MKLSAVVSVYNEEKKIEDCLKSLEFVDEIIIVDNESEDRTRELAEKYTKKIFTRKNNPMLNINKNFGFEKASGNWILNLDGDERVTPELKEEIKKILREDKNKTNGYWIPRKNILFGKWIKGEMWWPDKQLRLFRKGKGRFPEKHVHEYLEVEGEVSELKEALTHINYETIDQWLYKMQKIYSEEEARVIIEGGKKLSYLDALRLPVRDFLKTFFLQKGYKDGLHGLVLSLLQSLYMVVVFAKVWEKRGFYEEGGQEFKKEIISEMRNLGKEVRYWTISTILEEEKNPINSLLNRIKRRASRPR